MAVKWGGRGPGHMSRNTSAGPIAAPSLVLDFVGTSPATLSINLTAEPLGSCVAFQTDASQPQAGFAFFQVWS